MMRTTLLAFLLLPGFAAAQELRTGPGAPAISSQLPPTSMPGQATGRPGAEAPASTRPIPPGGTGHIRNVPASPDRSPSSAPVPGADSRPPADHQVLGAPPVPGATQPERSEGITTRRDVIPPDIGARIRPEASTTGRDSR